MYLSTKSTVFILHCTIRQVLQYQAQFSQCFIFVQCRRLVILGSSRSADDDEDEYDAKCQYTWSRYALVLLCNPPLPPVATHSPLM